MEILNAPKISIITASYNYVNLIVKSMRSVINQTYSNWELIIVDDGSSDNSVEVIKEYARENDNIYLFQHEGGINKGLKETLKLGISKAQGDYIAFLESDDFWAEDCLEKRVEVVKKYPDVGVIFNDIQMFGDEQTIKNFSKYKKKQEQLLTKIKFPKKIVMPFFLMNLIPTFSCVMFKRGVLESCNFDTLSDPILDYWLYMQMAAKNELFYIDEKLTHWYKHKESYIEKTNLIDGDDIKRELITLIEKDYKFSVTEKLFLKMLLNKKLEKLLRNLLFKIVLDL